MVSCPPSEMRVSKNTESSSSPYRHTYTDEEKKAYIDAELCLMDKEPILGLSAAKNRFEELQALHVLQSMITHVVVGFQPFNPCQLTFL